VKFCRGCPERITCAAELYAGRQPDCRAIKAGLPPPPIPTDPPLTLLEACGIVVRHWEMFGARGFDAAITLLKRVMERTRL
jgi:hypothetical protein